MAIYVCKELLLNKYGIQGLKLKDVAFIIMYNVVITVCNICLYEVEALKHTNPNPLTKTCDSKVKTKDISSTFS